MKKLEPGMLCRVVGSIVPENNGKIVRAVRSVGSKRGWVGTDWWEVDVDMLDNRGVYEPYIRGCRLQTINPDHQPADEEWQADFKRLLCGDKQPVSP